MGELTSKKRNNLPRKDFAVPGRKYPVPDKAHARNALARVSQFGTSKEKAEVRAKVKSKYPGIGEKGGTVKKSPAKKTMKKSAHKGAMKMNRMPKGHDAIGSHAGYAMGMKKRK